MTIVVAYVRNNFCFMKNRNFYKRQKYNLNLNTTIRCLATATIATNSTIASLTTYIMNTQQLESDYISA